MTAASDLHLATPGPVSAAFRVVVAEDHPVNRLLLTHQLGQLGYTDVAACTNGNEAWQAIADDPRGRVRLLITDLRMDGLDGFALARRVRAAQTPGGTRLAIVALTASTRVEETARCREAGIDALLIKPASVGDLQQAIGRALAACATAAPRDGGCDPR